MLKISTGLSQRGNSILKRKRTAAQTAQLRENKPHPMRSLLPSPKLRTDAIKHVTLSIDKSLQLMRIIHDQILHRSYRAFIPQSDSGRASSGADPPSAHAAICGLIYLKDRSVVSVATRRSSTADSMCSTEVSSSLSSRSQLFRQTSVSFDALDSSGAGATVDRS